jgi:hypothetical protein
MKRADRCIAGAELGGTGNGVSDKLSEPASDLGHRVGIRRSGTDWKCRRDDVTGKLAEDG